MDQKINKRADLRLLDALQDFVLTHPHPDVRRFKESIRAWGHEWVSTKPAYLKATDTLTSALAYTVNGTSSLVSLFEKEKLSRKWEQSYIKADGVIGDDMLAGYGFAEVIGKLGPFVSTRVRAGIGVWGPNMVYPAHRHQAEEVYILLAGSAEFCLNHSDKALIEMKYTGDCVYVPPMLIHGFSTKTEPLVVLYIWQAGNLREKSTFFT